MSEITAIRTALTLVAAALWLGAAAWLWRTLVPADLDPETLVPVDLFPPETTERARDYAQLPRLLWLGGTGVQVALLAVLAGGARSMVDRLPGTRVVRSLLLLAIVLAALWLAQLPFGLAGHWWRRRYDL